MGPARAVARGAGADVGARDGASIPRLDLRLAGGGGDQAITGLTPGQFWQREAGEPPGLRTWIGLPESEMESVARTEMPRDFDSRPVLSELDERAGTINGAIPFPGVGSEMSFNQPAIRRAELPGGNGISTERSLAKAYAACIDEIDRIRLLSDASIEDALIDVQAGAGGDAPGDDGPAGAQASCSPPRPASRCSARARSATAAPAANLPSPTPTAT